MTEYEAFLKAVLEDPSEANRLVFADWLEDHGEGKLARWFRQPHPPVEKGLKTQLGDGRGEATGKGRATATASETATAVATAANKATSTETPTARAPAKASIPARNNPAEQGRPLGREGPVPSPESR